MSGLPCCQRVSDRLTPWFLLVAAQGTSWVRGIVVDRVSATGALPSVELAPSIFSQFPLQCDVSRKIALAEGSKVAAFKVGGSLCECVCVCGFVVLLDVRLPLFTSGSLPACPCLT